MFLKEPNFIIIGALLVLLTISDSSAQSSPPEVDSLYYRAIALGDTNLDSMLSIASEIAVLSREFNDDYGDVKAKILSAYVYFNRFKLDTTRLLLDECERWFRDHPALFDSQNHGRVQLYQARLAVRKQEFRLAKLYATEALAIFRKIKDEKYEAEMLSVLGTIEYFMENYPTALSHFVAAIRSMTQSSDTTKRVTPDLLVNVSQVYSRMGQYENARAYARRSLKGLADKAGPKAGNIYNSIGSYYSSENRFDSAVYYYRLAKQNAMQNNLPHMVFIADYNVANVYARSGDHRKSIKELSRAISSASSPPPGMLEASQQMMAKNYVSLKQYDSAIFMARKTFRKNITRNSKLGVITDATVLSTAFQNIRQKDSALYYIKIKNAYQDSIYSADSQKKLSTLYAEMETIAKQKEIEFFQREADLAIAQKKILQLSIGFGIVLVPLAVGIPAVYIRKRRRQQKLLSYQLATELERRKKDLHQHALRMIYINNGLTEIENSLRKIKTPPAVSLQDIQQLFNDIQIDRSLEREWENFYRNFGSVHVGFYENFDTRFPQATAAERKLAGLVRMNLTNGEIAGLLHIESTSVKMAKYRLKKKLELNDDQDLYQYLQTFG